MNWPLKVLFTIFWLNKLIIHTENKFMANLIVHDNIDYTSSFYKYLIEDIRTHQDFETMLVFGCHQSLDRQIDAIYKLDVAKIIVCQQQYADFVKKHNSNVLVLWIVAHYFDEQQMERLSFTLNHIRQSRVLVIAEHIRVLNAFEEALLQACEKFQMTNVIVHYSNEERVKNQWLLLLKPYPKYNWHNLSMRNNNKGSYFQQHWRNMENSTLMTLPDQYLQNSVIYRDHGGRLKFYGIAARLVLLFGEFCNASVQLAYDVAPGEAINLFTFGNLTRDNVISIPMSVYPIYEKDIFTRTAYPLQVGTIQIMVPCAQHMLIREIYDLIVSKKCIAFMLLSVLLFSLLHTFVDYLTEGHFDIFNIFLNAKVITGVLGQSLSLKLTSMATLKIIYFLIFLLGLNLNTLFGAYLQTLVTSPPLHAQIKTIDDLTNSTVKLFYDPNDITPHSTKVLIPFKSVLVLAANTTDFQNSRKSLNIKYAYPVPFSVWSLFEQQQSYFAEKLFCLAPQLLSNYFALYGMILAEHSPLRKPLNYLTHVAIDMGLTQKWKNSAFLEMIKYKNITKSQFSLLSGFRDLRADDLMPVWMVLVVGLTAGTVVFLMELLALPMQNRLIPMWQKNVIPNWS